MSHRLRGRGLRVRGRRCSIGGIAGTIRRRGTLCRCWRARKWLWVSGQCTRDLRLDAGRRDANQGRRFGWYGSNGCRSRCPPYRTNGCVLGHWLPCLMSRGPPVARIERSGIEQDDCSEAEAEWSKSPPLYGRRSGAGLVPASAVRKGGPLPLANIGFTLAQPFARQEADDILASIDRFCRRTLEVHTQSG